MDKTDKKKPAPRNLGAKGQDLCAYCGKDNDNGDETSMRSPLYQDCYWCGCN